LHAASSGFECNIRSTVHSGSAIDLVPWLVSFTTTFAGQEVCKQERTQEQDKMNENVFCLCVTFQFPHGVCFLVLGTCFKYVPKTVHTMQDSFKQQQRFILFSSHTLFSWFFWNTHIYLQLNSNFTWVKCHNVLNYNNINNINNNIHCICNALHIK
jgi:hypothetical protein